MLVYPRCNILYPISVHMSFIHRLCNWDRLIPILDVSEGIENGVGPMGAPKRYHVLQEKGIPIVGEVRGFPNPVASNGTISGLYLRISNKSFPEVPSFHPREVDGAKGHQWLRPVRPPKLSFISPRCRKAGFHIKLCDLDSHVPGI